MSDTLLPFRVADLPQKRDTEINFAAPPELRRALATELGVDHLRKLSFKGALRIAGKSDWTLTGHLGATVVQPCVITLEPVTTRIEEPVLRHYIADWHEPTEAEIEMPEDDSSEQLGAEIDTMAAITEALSLAIPAYPREDGAALGALVHAEPGVEPLNEDTVKPFAGLADLKKKLDKGDG
ncbi:MAG: DUF177 domain-containing protein [Litoreibacter sp.]|nr:DUF177 domain-containing protein [Litoreibacter sp.]